MHVSIFISQGLKEAPLAYPNQIKQYIACDTTDIGRGTLDSERALYQLRRRVNRSGRSIAQSCYLHKLRIWHAQTTIVRILDLN